MISTHAATLTTAVEKNKMPVMSSSKKLGRELKALIALLESKYLYSPAKFEGRVAYFDLPKGGVRQSCNAVEFQAFPGTPFLIGVASAKEPSDRLRDAAIKHATENSTAGTLVLFSMQSGAIDVLRKKFKTTEFERVPDLEYNVAGQMEQRTLFSEGKLLPITNRLENLFFEIHSTLRDIDGMHADGALEELCKLLYLKSYVEDHLQDIPVPDVRSSFFGSCEEFASCLRGLLSVANAFDLQENKARIPEYEQSRGVFTEPFGLSSAALAKAFELLECYTLKESDADIKGRAFQKVLTKSVRAEMGQYFTPVPVCEMMVAIVSPTVTDRIMDPFCGSGHFLSLSLEHVRNHAGATPNQLSDFAYRSLFGIEKSDRLTRVAMTDMRMHGDGHSNIQCTDALLDFRNYPDLKPETFDVVLTNPPFGSILGAEAFSALADFQLASGRKRVPLEVVGLERSIELLRPGGRIAIVLPESIFNTESCRYIREWLQEKVRVRAIIDLPTETFSPFGANVQSGILVARKWETGERPRNDDRVCLVKVENLGYDASGRTIQGSEVAKVARHVSSFIGKDGW